MLEIQGSPKSVVCVCVFGGWVKVISYAGSTKQPKICGLHGLRQVLVRSTRKQGGKARGRAGGACAFEWDVLNRDAESYQALQICGIRISS